MKLKAAALLFVLLLPAGLSGESSPGGADDPLGRYLFPPEKVIGNAIEIGLDEGQKSSIRNEVHKAQAKFLDLQFDLQSEMEKMARLLQEKPVEEAKVLGELDRILGLEKEVKKTQISLLVRIKNVLTSAQQSKLSEIQRTAGK